MHCIERSGEVERADLRVDPITSTSTTRKPRTCVLAEDAASKFGGQRQSLGTRSTRCPGDPLRKILNSFTGPVVVDLDALYRIFPRFRGTEKCKLIVSLTGHSRDDSRPLFQIVIATFFDTVML